VENAGRGYAEAAPRAEESPVPWTEIEPRQFPAFEKDLEGISKQTMEDHYKLYQGYCNKTNECRRILKEFDYSEIEGNQIYSALRGVAVDYTFALLGFKNHELYFEHLGGSGGEPNGRFAEMMEEEFPGGLEMWKQAVRKSASAARGWAMVGYDLNDGSLFNYIMDSQNLWAVYNMVPVLAIDVYEHAYARDFGGTPDGRKEYVEAFFSNLDWDHVNRQLAQAEAAREGANQQSPS
jgi:Fe-Mn family superoxide dismutase